MTERYRAIIIKDGKLVVMERFKNGRHYWVFPGGGREGEETEAECCEREVMEEFGIEVKAKKMIYFMEQSGTLQGFFVCDWINGEIHKTDAVEYSSYDPDVYGTYNPTTINVDELENYPTLYPQEIAEQLIKDLKQYGTELNRPLLNFKLTLHE